MTLVVRCEKLTRVFRTGEREVVALRDVSLTLPPGAFIALVGRSGSGKTTLLNLIGGLDRPTAGEVTVLGQPLGRLDDGELTALRRYRIGFVFQSFALLPALSAFDNVALPLRIASVEPRKRDKRVWACLEAVGLREWAVHRPYELSGGQQQRVAIARALVNDPPLILADEPTGELDSGTAREIFNFFQRLARERGVTVIAATHDPLVDEYALSTIRLRDGQVEASSLNGSLPGPPESFARTK